MDRLPDELRAELISARQKLGWSQAEVGRRAGLPQVHISGIETGKVVPRYNTLLDLVRILGFDLLLVPRTLVPAMRSLIRDLNRTGTAEELDERPLYATDEEPENP